MAGAQPLIGSGDRSIPVIVQARSGTPPAPAFAAVVPIDLTLVFGGWGPFPAVTGVEDQTGSWDHAGASRKPQLSDGSQATESITEYVRGHSFAYEITAFTGVFGRLVAGVRGEWTFTPDGGGSVITWTYEFKPRTVAAPVVHAIAPFWKRYMETCLERVVAYLEQGASRVEQGSEGGEAWDAR